MDICLYAHIRTHQTIEIYIIWTYTTHIYNLLSCVCVCVCFALFQSDATDVAVYDNDDMISVFTLMIMIHIVDCAVLIPCTCVGKTSMYVQLCTHRTQIKLWKTN